MSMNGAVVRLTAEDLGWLRSYTTAKTDDQGEPLEDRTDAWFFCDNPSCFEMEKAFAGVHFLLTGTDLGGAGPLSFIANASFGEAVPYDFAYGPGRVIDVAAVEAIADGIEALPARIVRERLGSAELRSVYPFSLRSLGDDDKEWLLAVLQELMTFMRQAATDGVPVLVAVL